MERFTNKVLDIASKSRQLHVVDLKTMTYSWTKIKNLKNRQLDYKILCQLSNDKLLCCYYDKSLKKSVICYINTNGNISYRACFNLFEASQSWLGISIECFYKNIKGIKYKNYVYIIIPSNYCIYRYNLLKNICSKSLKIHIYFQSWAIIEDKILICGDPSKGIIYDCNINSISPAFTFQSLGSKCVGVFNKSFFIFDICGIVIKSEELNPYKWTLLGKIFSNHIDFTKFRMINYDNFTYYFSKGNLYKFDLENLSLTKTHFIFGKKEAYSQYKMLSLEFRKIENSIEITNWVKAFKPIEHYFIGIENYIEKILNIAFQPYDFPIKFLFEYPKFEDRKIIIIQDYFWSGIANSLKNNPELFNYKNKSLKILDYLNEFRLFILKNWSKQGVIIPSIYYFKRQGVKNKEIVEALKNGKKGLIWILNDPDSRNFYEFIDQSEDKVIIDCPDGIAFQLTNDLLREAGEKEIDWRIL